MHLVKDLAQIIESRDEVVANHQNYRSDIDVENLMEENDSQELQHAILGDASQKMDILHIEMSDLNPAISNEL